MRLEGARVMVTGGAGFLGRYLVERLHGAGCTDVFVPRSADFDLTVEAGVRRAFEEARPELVIHLAAVVGGIGANQRSPGRFAYDNLMMGALVLEQARRSGVRKFVGVGTICAYPKHAPIPFREEDLWNGYPEETNAAYGLAKKMLLVQSQAYRQQYGFNAIHLLPVNLYGPGDNFDPESCHVIPGLIRKCLEAVAQGSPQIVCWGDGTPTREFLFAADCAEAIVLAAQRYDEGEPVNLGSGHEFAIADLVQLIAELTGFHGEVVWDPTRPNGQPRRCVDTRRAFESFGFRARTDFVQGLRETIEAYRRSEERP